MSRGIGLILLGYLAFVWQASLRPEWMWSGCGPHFLALAMVVAVWCLDETRGVLAAAVLGCGSDVWAARGLGPEMLSFTLVAMVLQGCCPPKLIRHPLGHVSLVAVCTWCVTSLGLLIRLLALPETIPLQWSSPLADWQSVGLRLLGEGVLTAGLFGVVLLAVHLWSWLTQRDFSGDVGQTRLTNQWQRLL